MSVHFLKREGKLTQPTIDLYLSLVLHQRFLKHIVHHCIMKHPNDQNILTDCQHGFRAKGSTEMQLILALRDIAKLLIRSLIGIS